MDKDLIWIPVIIIAGCLWLKWEYNMAVKEMKKKESKRKYPKMTRLRKEQMN